MANIAEFELKILGKKYQVNAMEQMLARTHPHYYIDSNLSALEFYQKPVENGLWELSAIGNCDWSIEFSMREMKTLSSNEIKTRKTLDIMASEWNLVIEGYSSEPLAGRAEHMLIDGDTLLIDETKEYHHLSMESSTSQGIKNFCEAHGIDFWLHQSLVNEYGDLVIGGFGEWDFAQISKYYTREIPQKRHLIERTEEEYDDFIAEMKTLQPDEIIDKAQEIYVKDNIFYNISNEDDYANIEVDVKLNLLDYIYAKWAEDGAESENEKILDCVNSTIFNDEYQGLTVEASDIGKDGYKEEPEI